MVNAIYDDDTYHFNSINRVIGRDFALLINKELECVPRFTRNILLPQLIQNMSKADEALERSVEMSGKKVIGRVYSGTPSSTRHNSGEAGLMIGLIHNELTRVSESSKRSKKQVVGRVNNSQSSRGASKKSSVVGRIENELKDKKNSKS